MQVALRVADHAGLRRDVEAHHAARAHDEFRRAAADVDDQEVRPGILAACRRGAEEGEAGLLVAAQGAAVEPVALADRGRERVPVLRIPHGRRHHGEAPVGAVGVERRGVLVERGEHTLLGRVAEPAAGVDSPRRGA
jgi:hypothetical protein